VFSIWTRISLTRALIALVVARAVDDSGVVLVHGDTLGAAEVLQGRGAFKIKTHFLGDHGAAGQDRDVLQHRLATITEARCLTRCNLDDTAHVVHNQCRQCFAFNVFRNDHQRLGRLGNLLEQGSSSRMLEIFLSTSRM
jgi:hypothetical protein